MHLSTLLALASGAATAVLATPLQLRQAQPAMTPTPTPGAASNGTTSVQYCGDQPYYPSAYVCYNGTALCPIVAGVPTLSCGRACYDPSVYGCANGNLVQLNAGNGTGAMASAPAGMYPATITPVGTPMATPQ